MTPAIRDCGVAGVMRQVVLDGSAGARHCQSSIEDVLPDRLANADELFVTNAVVGIRPVAELAGVRRWDGSASSRSD